MTDFQPSSTGSGGAVDGVAPPDPAIIIQSPGTEQLSGVRPHPPEAAPLALQASGEDPGGDGGNQGGGTLQDPGGDGGTSGVGTNAGITLNVMASGDGGTQGVGTDQDPGGRETQPPTGAIHNITVG